MSDSFDSLESLGIALMVVIALVVLLVLSSALACVQYLIAFGNMKLTDNGRILHVSHGLLKTRQTTLDRARLRGTTLKEPLLLRLARGARLDAIMTGVSAEKKESSLLLPQGPRREAERVMATVIGDSRQASAPLILHGPAARRRRYTRALFLAAVAFLVCVACAASGLDVPIYAWFGVAVLAIGGTALAYDRYNGLGHAVLPGWLITRNGSLDRQRHSLESEGVIGWTVRETFFQTTRGSGNRRRRDARRHRKLRGDRSPRRERVGIDRSRHSGRWRRVGRSSMMSLASEPRRDRSGWMVGTPRSSSGAAVTGPTQ